MNKSDKMVERRRVAILLGEPSNYDTLAFRYFILALNQLQTLYEFYFPDYEIKFAAQKYSENRLIEMIKSARHELSPRPDYLIVIITSSISGNLFFVTLGRVAAITTDVWEKYFSPPSLFEFLLHCIAANLLFMHPALDLDPHNEEIRGCVLDYTKVKEHDRVDIALGYICDEDAEHIRNAIDEAYLHGMRSVISRRWIGSIDDNGSVAYNLKHFFRFDIARDSGFNKTLWERTRDMLDELPTEGLKAILTTIITIVVTAVITAVLVFIGLRRG